MLEQFATLLGRNVHVRGVGRVLGRLYPCGLDSLRYVRGIRTRGDGLRMELDTRQLIDWSLLFRGDYEPHMQYLFGKLLLPGAVAVDVGANIGAHTLTLARLVGSSGRVLAFEPNPAIGERLERNTALNDLGHVEVYRCALGFAEARMSLRVPSSASAESANPGMASLVALDTPHDLVDVEVRALDLLWPATGLQHFDLVKIDVQGYEHPVLLGMTGLINRFAPAILFEYEDWAWKEAGWAFRDAFDLLDRRGYSLWRISCDQRLELFPISRGRVPGPHAEVLAIARDDPRMRQLSAVARGAFNG
jgi:FkbM family methyltransferase